METVREAMKAAIEKTRETGDFDLKSIGGYIEESEEYKAEEVEKDLDFIDD